MKVQICLKGASVSYPIVTSNREVSILGAVAQGASFGLLRRGKSGLTYVQSLRNINLNLAEGARLGVIGRNGSGKSTLLKTLAGILSPTSGNRIVTGSIASVLSVGAGLDMEKTGRQNVRLVQKLFGGSGPELDRAEADVDAFIDIDRFFDLPVRTYSSGMLVRLCFAIATYARGEILLVDEILGAGDLHFLQKAADRIKGYQESAKIMVIATHDPVALERFCDKVIWMHAGRIIMYGTPAEVWDAYSNPDPDFISDAPALSVNMLGPLPKRPVDFGIDIGPAQIDEIDQPMTVLETAESG
jgi:ABC-type polysaccharide/polyol phosphate transport system ATPase subunit